MVKNVRSMNRTFFLLLEIISGHKIYLAVGQNIFLCPEHTVALYLVSIMLLHGLDVLFLYQLKSPVTKKKIYIYINPS